MCAKDKAEFSCLLHLVLNSKGNAAMNTFGTALVANPETIGRETTLLYFCVPLQGVGTLCVFSFLVYIKIYNMNHNTVLVPVLYSYCTHLHLSHHKLAHKLQPVSATL